MQFGEKGGGASTLEEAALVNTDAAEYLAKVRRGSIHVVSETSASPAETIAILLERQAHAAAGGTFKTPPQGDYPTLESWHAAAKPLSLDPAQRQLDGFLDCLRENWGSDFVDYALKRMEEEDLSHGIEGTAPAPSSSLDIADLGAKFSRFKVDFEADAATHEKRDDFVGPVLVRAVG